MSYSGRQEKKNRKIYIETSYGNKDEIYFDVFLFFLFSREENKRSFVKCFHQLRLSSSGISSASLLRITMEATVSGEIFDLTFETSVLFDFIMRVLIKACQLLRQTRARRLSKSKKVSRNVKKIKKINFLTKPARERKKN